MKLQVHSIHFDADQKLLAFIQVKLNKLDQFSDRIISGEVFLRLGKGESSKVLTKQLDIKIHLPGGYLFVKEAGRSFEEATDLAIEALKAQLKRYKDKTRDKTTPETQKALAQLGLLTEEEVI